MRKRTKEKIKNSFIFILVLILILSMIWFVGRRKNPEKIVVDIPYGENGEISWSGMYEELREKLKIPQGEDFYMDKREWLSNEKVNFILYEQEYHHIGQYGKYTPESILSHLAQLGVIRKVSQGEYEVLESTSEGYKRRVGSIKGKEKLLKENYLSGEEYFKFIEAIEKPLKEAYRIEDEDSIELFETIVNKGNFSKASHRWRTKSGEIEMILADENGAVHLQDESKLDGKYLQLVSWRNNFVILYKVR